MSQEVWVNTIQRLQSSLLVLLSEELAEQLPRLGMPLQSQSLYPPEPWGMNGDNANFRLFDVEFENMSYAGALWTSAGLEEELISTCGEIYLQFVNIVLRENPALRAEKVQLRPVSQPPTSVSNVVWIPVEFSSGRLALAVAKYSEK